MANVDLVQLEMKQNTARITLNRPEKRNALSPALITALQESLRRLNEETQVSMIVLAGAGKDFCAGMDISTLEKGSQADAIDHMNTARHLAELLLAIRRHRCPVIAAVHGRALGGGAGIAAACDLVLAAESAEFGYPEVNIGFVPAMVAAFVRRNVAEKRMFELLVFGAPVKAAEALAMGLINRVFPDASFAEGAEAYVQNLAKKSATALSLTKRLLYHTDGMTLEQAVEAGVQVNALSRTTGDAKKGFAGFVKK